MIAVLMLRTLFVERSRERTSTPEYVCLSFVVEDCQLKNTPSMEVTVHAAD